MAKKLTFEEKQAKLIDKFNADREQISVEIQKLEVDFQNRQDKLNSDIADLTAEFNENTDSEEA